jgi:murein DD-endopeptidase MepM/ murein hydrolase activator NlpD
VPHHGKTRVAGRHRRAASSRHRAAPALQITGERGRVAVLTATLGAALVAGVAGGAAAAQAAGDRDAAAAQSADARDAAAAGVVGGAAAAPERNRTAPERDVTTPERNETASERDVTAPARDVTTPERDVTAPERDVNASERNETAPERDVTGPERNGIASERDVTAAPDVTAMPNVTEMPDVTAMPSDVTTAEPATVVPASDLAPAKNEPRTIIAGTPAPAGIPAEHARRKERERPKVVAPRPAAWVNPNPTARVTSCFGQRWGRLHAGVDLAAADHTPIVAAGAGVVVRAGAAQGYGNAVLIDHGDGYLTHYGHLSLIAVQVGQHVAAGERIGEEGSTGHSTGPHLHFEVHQGYYQNPVEPTRWMHDHGVDIPGCVPSTNG